LLIEFAMEFIDFYFLRKKSNALSSTKLFPLTIHTPYFTLHYTLYLGEFDVRKVQRSTLGEFNVKEFDVLKVQCSTLGSSIFKEFDVRKVQRSML